MLRLTYKRDIPAPISAEALSPDRLTGVPAAAVAGLQVMCGEQAALIGDFFKVVGNAFESSVEIIGDCSKLTNLGQGMKSGKLAIWGDVGSFAGSDMVDGELIVHGSVGNFVGADMRGGSIDVRENAGDFACAARDSNTWGMRGGVVFVRGNVGNFLAHRMRRGLIAIAGRTGDNAAAGMRAGTLFAFGGAGHGVGNAMAGGTIYVGGPAEVPPSFVSNCVFEPVFLRMGLRLLRSWEFPVPDGLESQRVRRYIAPGAGELLTPV